MIQAKELRIGNWVYIDSLDIDTGKWHKKEHEIIYRDLWNLENGNELVKKSYEPIPLTEEWHLKFGAEKVEIEVYCYAIPTKRSVNIEIRFNDADVYVYQGDDIILVWDYDYALRGMYVHEWQNLYFALTGEELTIKN